MDTWIDRGINRLTDGMDRWMGSNIGLMNGGRDESLYRQYDA